MDETGDYYAKLNKPGTERQIPFVCSHAWELIPSYEKKRKNNNSLRIYIGEKDKNYKHTIKLCNL